MKNVILNGSWVEFCWTLPLPVSKILISNTNNRCCAISDAMQILAPPLVVLACVVLVLWHRSEDCAETTQEAAPLPSGIRGLGMGLPDLRGKKQKGKQKAPKDRTHVAETLDKLRQQTRETVKGLESVTGGDDFDSSAMMEDWVKQFEELAGSQVLSIFLIHWVAIYLPKHSYLVHLYMTALKFSCFT